MTVHQAPTDKIPITAPEFGPEEIAAVERVMESGLVADGPEVRQFETAFGQYCGAEHAIATANGTAALHAAFEAVGIGPGDRVVTTPFSFVASANAIRLAGATPIFADIDPVTFNLDPEATEAAVRASDADAILAVHLYGLPADMGALCDIAEDAGAWLVEDAAQAHGARWEGQPVGSFGDAAAFSFYPTKNMSTAEGGMVTTNRESVADRTRSYINHGRDGSGTYTHNRLGHNYRMTSIAAAIGRVQLDRLPEWIDARRRNANWLTAGLEPIPGVDVPVEPDGQRHAYHQYTVRTQNRDQLQSRLEEHGVETSVYYPTPIHELGAYDGYDIDAPEAERAAREVLSLPVHPSLDKPAIDAVVEAVSREFVHAL